MPVDCRPRRRQRRLRQRERCWRVRFRFARPRKTSLVEMARITERDKTATNRDAPDVAHHLSRACRCHCLRRCRDYCLDCPDTKTDCQRRQSLTRTTYFKIRTVGPSARALTRAAEMVADGWSSAVAFAMNISSTLLPTERLIIAAATCSHAAMARF